MLRELNEDDEVTQPEDKTRGKLLTSTLSERFTFANDSTMFFLDLSESPFNFNVNFDT